MISRERFIVRTKQGVQIFLGTALGLSFALVSLTLFHVSVAFVNLKLDTVWWLTPYVLVVCTQYLCGVLVGRRHVYIGRGLKGSAVLTTLVYFYLLTLLWYAIQGGL